MHRSKYQQCTQWSVLKPTNPCITGMATVMEFQILTISHTAYGPSPGTLSSMLSIQGTRMISAVFVKDKKLQNKPLLCAVKYSKAARLSSRESAVVLPVE